MTASARDIFLDAVERHAPPQWPAFLDEACGSDNALRSAVERLLHAHQQVDSFMAQPAAGGLETAPQPPTPQLGAYIGRYKLLEQLGEGGMGIVYVAEQTEPVRRKVALKVIKPGMDTRQVIARFEAERQALAMMDHPHIAKVLDAGATESGHPYFVMELVRGLPITDYCDQAKLTPIQRLELFATVCQAVQHAHQRGIIHRDLKPGNVLVTLHDGVPVPKVIDFGIAKAISQSLTEHTLHTGHLQMMGTPLYMSPEQAEMSGLDVDTRSDVYSLGVLLYELLTGQTPFDKDTLQAAGDVEMRRIIREQEPPSPSKKVSSLNGEPLSTASRQRGLDERRLSQVLRGELDWIVMKALDKDRNRRYESASTFAADVQRYLKHEPVEASPPSSWYRVRKYARRHRGALATALVLSLTLLSGTGVSLWQAYEANQARDVAEDALIEKGKALLRADEAGRQAIEQFRQAETERKKADASYQKARDTVRKLLSEVATEEVVRIPGMRKVYVKLLDEAIASYDELIELKPNDVEIYADQGELYLLKGDFLWAQQKFQRAVELLPGEASAHFGLARAMEGSWPPQFDEGMVDVGAGVISRPKFADVETASGEVALQHIERAIELSKDDATSQKLLRAMILYRLARAKDAAQAIAEIEKQEALTPSQMVALAEVCNAMGQHERGLRHAEQALARDRGNPLAWYQRGESHRLAGHYAKAVTAYTESLQRDPLVNHQQRLEMLQRRADAHLGLGKYAEALADCNIVLQADPARWLLLKRRALAKFHLADFSGALADLQQAYQLHPEDGSILTWIRPHLVVRCQDQAFVQDMFELTAASQPALAGLLLARAELNVERKEYDAALQDLLRAAELGSTRVARSPAAEALSERDIAYRQRIWPIKAKFDETIATRYEDAKVVLVDAFKRFGRESPITRDALLSKVGVGAVLADKLSDESQLEPAVEVALGDYTDCRLVFGDEQNWSLIGCNNLALRCLFAGRYDDVERLLGPTAYDGTLDRFDGDDTRTFYKKRVLGLALLRIGKLDAAEAQFNQALDVSRRVHGEQSAQVLSLLNLLAEVTRVRGDLARAETQQAECLKLCRETLGEGHLETLQATDQLALVYEAGGKFAELEALAREYWTSRQHHTPGLAKTSHAQSLLGASLLGLQRLDEAEPLLLKAFENLSKSPSLGQELTSDVARAARRLARLHEVKGNPSEVARWQQIAKKAEADWPPPEAKSMPLPADAFGPVTTKASPLPLTFDLRLVPGLKGEILSLSEEGNIVTRRKTAEGLQVPVVYWAPQGTAAERIVEASDLLSKEDASRWKITFTYAANKQGEIICQAQDAAGLHQLCRLNYSAGVGQGTLTPIMPSTHATVHGINADGVICGRFQNRAFIMARGDSQPQYLFPGEDADKEDQSVAFAVNSWGEVVGRKNGRGFRCSPAKVQGMRSWTVRGEKINGGDTLLVELDGHIPSQGSRTVNTARVINDSGHFAGETLGNVVSEPESSKKRVKEYYAYEFLDVPYLVNGKLRSTAWDLI